MGEPTIVLVKTLCALPNVERGYGFHMYSTSKKENQFIYTSSKGVMMRNFSDPSEATAYCDHKATPRCAQFSPNGEWVASGDAHGLVHIWGRKNHVKKYEYPCVSQCNDICWDADGKRIAVVGSGTGSYAKVFSWDTGTSLGALASLDNIISVDYKHQRPYKIITGCEDNTVGFHQGPPFKAQATNKDHARYPNKVKFSPDGEVFMTVGSDSKIFVFDGKTGEKVREVEDEDNGHKKSAIWCFDWSPDGKEFITTSADKTCKIWNFESGKVLTTFQFGSHADQQQMSALWDGDNILSVSLSGQINILDRAKPEEPKSVIYGHKSPITCLVTNSKTGDFYSGDGDGRVSVWKDFQAKWLEGAGHEKSIILLSLSHDGETLMSVGLDDKVRFNVLSTGKFSEETTPLARQGKAAASGRASTIAAVVTSGQKIYMFKDGKLTGSFELPFDGVSLAFSNDDSEIAVGGSDKKLHFFDPSGDFKTETRTLEGLLHLPTLVQWTPDGKHLAVTQKNGTKIYSNDGFKQQNPTAWEMHTSAVTGVAVSPSGKKVLTVAPDLSVICWHDTETWKTKRVAEKMAHRQGIVANGFLSETQAVTVGSDGVIKVWEV